MVAGSIPAQSNSFNNASMFICYVFCFTFFVFCFVPDAFLATCTFPAQAASFSSQFVSSPFAASVSCLSFSYPLRGPPPSPSILHRSSPQLCDLSPSLVHDLSLPLSSCSSPSLALTCDSSPQSLLSTATHPDNFPPPGLPPQCFISSAFAMSSNDLLMSPVNSYPLLQSPTP